MICDKGEKPVEFEQITTPSPAMETVKTTTRAPITVAVVEEEEEAEAETEATETEGEAEETSDNEAEVVESNDGEEEEVEDVEEEEEVTVRDAKGDLYEHFLFQTTPEPKPFNPLRYRPPHLPRQSTGIRRA